MKKSIESIQIVIDIENGIPTRESLRCLFFDMDFIENEDKYREDTLKLGFAYEADRVIDELIRHNPDLIPTELIQAVVDIQINSTGYYGKCIVHTTTFDELSLIVVSISYETIC